MKKFIAGALIGFGAGCFFQTVRLGYVYFDAVTGNEESIEFLNSWFEAIYGWKTFFENTKK